MLLGFSEHSEHDDAQRAHDNDDIHEKHNARAALGPMSTTCTLSRTSRCWRNRECMASWAAPSRTVSSQETEMSRTKVYKRPSILAPKAVPPQTLNPQTLKGPPKPPNA